MTTTRKSPERSRRTTSEIAKTMVKRADVRNLIRETVRRISAEQSALREFKLSGRGHEPRVTLDIKLAATLRYENLPRIFISGYGPKYFYPRAIFEWAREELLSILGWAPLELSRTGVWLSYETNSMAS